MFVVYEVCSGWSEEDMRFTDFSGADLCALTMSEKYGTEFQIREEAN